MARINHLCNQVGVDTIEAGAAIGVAMEAGVIPFGDLAGAKRAEEQRRERTPGAPQAEPALDPYSVLGIGPSATAGEVRAAYRTMMGQYHPDKVAHLGPELRELAHRKSQEITRAYRTLASG